MGSMRLQGKMCMKIQKKPMAEWVIQRVMASKNVKQIILATTTNQHDKKLVNIAKRLRVKLFCGSPDDVLDRYYQAATLYHADPVIRITGDCPLIDPDVIDEVIANYQKKHVDYTCTPKTYPEGLDVEVLSYKALARAWKEAKKPSEREHVTPYIKNHPKLFTTYFPYDQRLPDHSSYHWSVDQKEDLKFVRAVYRHLYHPKRLFHTADVIALLTKKPSLLEFNKDFTGYEGYRESLKKDRKNSRTPNARVDKDL